MTKQETPRVAARITVGLTDRAATALLAAHERTGDSKTDVVNRALQLYAYFTEETADGTQWFLRRKSGEVESIRLL